MSNAILLDTHVAIWLSLGRLDSPATILLASAALDDGLLVSPVVAWEVGLLARSPVRASYLGFKVDPGEWYRSLLTEFKIGECRLDADIALASTKLPGKFHKDPADRFLVATARVLDCRLMTRDRKILAYADEGHVKAIAC